MIDQINLTRLRMLVSHERAETKCDLTVAERAESSHGCASRPDETARARERYFRLTEALDLLDKLNTTR